jgi:hypothetical protein
MDSDGESELPEWAAESSNKDGDAASINAHASQQVHVQFKSNARI